MKKLVVYVITTLILLHPMMGVFANSNPDHLGFEFVFLDNFSEDLVFRSKVEVDILSQIEIFEKTFDIELENNTKFRIFPCENQSYLANKRKGNGTLNLIISKNFEGSIGHINPIFSSILLHIWPNCPLSTIDILSFYLATKYLEIDPIQLATEIRYAYSEIPLTKDPDKNHTLSSSNTNTILLAASRIYQFENETEPELFKNFLYSCRFGIDNSIKRYFGIEFSTFIRSLRYEVEKDEVMVKTEPTEQTKILLQKIEEQRLGLWKDLPQFSSDYDFQIRMRPNMTLYQAIFQIAKEHDKNQIESTLAVIDDYYSWKNSNNRKTWLILLASVFSLIVLLFFSIVYGIRFKQIPVGKKK